MTPEQASFLLQDVYLPQIKNEFKTTRRVIEAVPAGKLDYRPDDKAKTSWDLAKHIATADVFFVSGVANGGFNPADAALPDSVKTPADLLKWFDEKFADAVARLSAVKGADLLKELNFAVFNLRGIDYVGLMISHSIHHRGQLSTYLRPMGSKIPRIYGGSADEPIEMRAEH